MLEQERATDFLYLGTSSDETSCTIGPFSNDAMTAILRTRQKRALQRRHADTGIQPIQLNRKTRSYRRFDRQKPAPPALRGGPSAIADTGCLARATITLDNAKRVEMVLTGSSSTVLYNVRGGVSRALTQSGINDGLPDGVKRAIIAPGLTSSLKSMTQYAGEGC